MLITSKLKGDNLRVLVKNQLSQDGPKIKWLETKPLRDTGSANFRIKLPNIVAERTQDFGEITDNDISYMLRYENELGIDKVSSIFNSTRTSFSTEYNLDMLKSMLAMQEGQTLESYSGHRLSPIMLPILFTHWLSRNTPDLSMKRR